MATGGYNRIELSDYNKTSEEVKMIYCDPCKSEDINAEADGFCLTCEEYLCNSCCQAHGKFRAFRTHSLLYGNSMPRDRGERKIDSFVSYCSAHPTNKVQYYCSGHQDVYCRICQTTKHTQCEYQRIRKVCDIDRDRSKLHQTVASIKNIQESFEQMKEEDEAKISKLQANSKNDERELKNLRKQMNKICKDLKNEIESDKKKAGTTIQDLKQKIAVSTDIVDHLTSFQKNLSPAVDTNDPAVMFAALVKSTNVNSEYQDVKAKIEEKFHPSYSSEVSICIKQVMKMCEDIAELLENQKSSNETPVKQKKKQPKHKKSISNENPWIQVPQKPSMTSQEYESTSQLKSSTVPTSLSVGERLEQAIQLNMVESRQQKQKTDSKGKKDSERSTQELKSAFQFVLGQHGKGTNKGRQDNNDSELFKNNNTSNDNKQTETVSVPNNIKMQSASIPTQTKKPLSNLKVVGAGSVTIRPINNKLTCDITGCLFLPCGSIVLCDHSNNSLILLDNNFNKIQDDMTFKGPVWDVASMSDDEIIVSLTRNKMIQFVTVLNGKLKEGAHFKMKKVCWGVASDGEHIFVTFHDNPGNGMVEIRNRRGGIVKQITTSDLGIELLTPYYISLDQQKGCILISDGKQNSIICTNMDGQLLGKIQGDSMSWPRGMSVGENPMDDIKWPRGMIIGENQSLAIYSYQSNTFNILQELTNRQGKPQWHSRILYQVQRPQAASIRWNDMTLVITSNNSNTISVLKCTL